LASPHAGRRRRIQRTRASRRLLHTLNLSPEHCLEFYAYDRGTGVLELRPYDTEGVMDGNFVNFA
jgi:hypothetical protein